MTAAPQRRDSLPSVSVVVTTHRRAEVLRTSLPAVLGDSALTELVVVVDGSDDGSLEYVEELQRADARVIPVWTEAVGAPRARQQGIEVASGDVVLLLDDDVVAEPGLVGGHARHHQRRADLLVVGFMPVATPPERRPGQAAVFLYAEEYETMCERYEREPGSILEHLWLGNVSLRRRDARRVPTNSVAFGALYHEDRDYGLRLRSAGFTAEFDRTLQAAHLYERSLDAFMRGAYSQGEGIVSLHACHPASLGPVDPASFGAGLPLPVSKLVGLARRRRAERLLTAALLEVASAAGHARQWTVERLTVRLLRRIAQQRGALDALRRTTSV